MDMTHLNMTEDLLVGHDALRHDARRRRSPNSDMTNLVINMTEERLDSHDAHGRDALRHDALRHT